MKLFQMTKAHNKKKSTMKTANTQIKARVNEACSDPPQPLV